MRLHAHECDVLKRLVRRAIGPTETPACEPTILTGTWLIEIVVRICSLLRPGEKVAYEAMKGILP
jgi:hypothetical protein